ncbi:hypothetical protein CLV62_1017 [Dysgonomonas alginatilytica]|uniref:Virulence RhuM family protein n=1 Tax=Dysgonomonas alginatilytica TaxID=1605892 RepID=A0A2V3Q0B3_9BACT|nr:hypothetical protein [Dysgonomonas alginatilytica]PXV68745.1 hypothetical protein CLV62_1017 [Dysgonomonas alginatilytica]
METGYIKFSNVETDKPIIEVKLVDGTVWMTVNEIAELFGVYTPTIYKHLRGMFKDNLLREREVTKEYTYSALNGGEYIRVYYNLEVIIFLSFRIQSIYIKVFREWVLNAFCEYSRRKKEHEVIVIFNTKMDEYSLKTLN